MEPTLVVDFGTSTSTAALVTRGATRLLAERGTGALTWPSAVCLAGETLLVGTSAERAKRAHPGAYRSEFKQDLGDEGRIPLGTKSYTPQDLVIKVLEAFAGPAERAAGRPIQHLMLTVPSSYADDDPRRQLMIEAGERAGFPYVEVLPEPVAAAHAPVEGAPLPPEATVLVYDLGGGTFDAAVVRIEGAAHQVLGCGAREHCGGRDVDAELRRMIAEQSGERLPTLLARADEPTDSPSQADRRARLELQDQIHDVKHQLSEAPVAVDHFALVDRSIEVQAVDLRTRIAPILQETVDCCHEALAACSVAASDLTAILLVGGSTRMPVVAQTLEREFGVVIRHTEDPGTAVAQGAAAWVRARPVGVVAPWPLDTGHVPVRWKVPEESGTVVRWLVATGDTVAEDQPLLLLRTAAGVLTRLTAGSNIGELADQHVEEGDVIFTGQWLATLRPATVGASTEDANDTTRIAEITPPLPVVNSVPVSEADRPAATSRARASRYLARLKQFLEGR